jgi:hypothetical protein
MFEIQDAPPRSSVSWFGRRLGFHLDSFRTRELPGTHPRGFPTIHLSKSKANFRSQTPMATFVTIVVSFLHRVIPDWGGGIISFVSAVSTGVANFIFQSFAATTSTANSLGKASIGQNRETTSLSLTAPEHYDNRAAKVRLRSVNQICRVCDYGRSS